MPKNTVIEYTVTLGAEDSRISATVRIVDTVQSMELPCEPGSALENACLNLDAEVIAAISASFEAGTFTRPLS